MQNKITSVNKIAQQEREGQLNESIELTDPLNKKIEDILKIKDEVPGLTPYPSSESLCEFEKTHIKPIEGNTLPPQYSREISQYQPLDKERARAMKDALSAVRQFTSEGNLSKNGNINITAMREMWDYENREPSSSKTKDASEVIPEGPKNVQSISKVECKLCGGNHETDQCPHESRFSQLGKDASKPKTRNRFHKGKSRSIDYFKLQWKWPSLWKPTQSVNGKTSPVGPQNAKNKLTSENLSELGPEKYELEMGCGQVLLDQKTKAWVDEQNKINKKERPRYGRLYNEGEDLMYPDPQLDAGSPIKGQKGGTTATYRKRKRCPTAIMCPTRIC